MSSSVCTHNKGTAGQASSGTRHCLFRRSLFRRTGGFTLVELIVTITIIAIIAGIALGGMFAAQESARRDRTRGIIAKLHGQLMLRWESYETRRVPIVRKTLFRDPVTGRGRAEQPGEFAARRLQALRELMRLELPDRWNDVPADEAEIQHVTRPALSEAYLRRYQRNTDPLTGQLLQPSALYQSAECLFLILSMGHDDALGTDRINLREVGDVDQDGMKEFLDGWGRPIRFLRWAPGYLPDGSPSLPGNGTLPGALTDLQTGDPADDPDPFDHRGVDSWTAFAAGDAQRGYRLMPLIYSSGADGKPDIKGDHEQPVGSGNFFNYAAVGNDPYAKQDVDGEMLMMGAPFDLDDDGSVDHLDNISNHGLVINQRN